VRIRKHYTNVELGEDEKVYTAAVSVGIFDDDGNRQKIVAGNKYVVSGDCGNYFVKPKKKEAKDDRTVSP
jgi:hypothetical protein